MGLALSIRLWHRQTGAEQQHGADGHRRAGGHAGLYEPGASPCPGDAGRPQRCLCPGGNPVPLARRPASLPGRYTYGVGVHARQRIGSRPDIGQPGRAEGLSGDHRAGDGQGLRAALSNADGAVGRLRRVGGFDQGAESANETGHGRTRSDPG